MLDQKRTERANGGYDSAHAPSYFTWTVGIMLSEINHVVKKAIVSLYWETTALSYFYCYVIQGSIRKNGVVVV